MGNIKSISSRFALTSVLLVVVLLPMQGRAQTAANQWDLVPRVVHVPVLMYHYIDTPPANSDRFLIDLAVSRANFEQQVKWLKDNGYTSITPDALMAALWHGAPLPPKPVMLTFDDGYANAWYNALPVLTEVGFTGTFFVVTDWLDQNKPGYLTWPLAQTMTHLGMAIEDHSRNHEDFRNRPHDWYVDEIVESMKDIEQHTNVKPVFFCYPFGGYDDVAIRELQDAGFIAAFTENDSRYEYASNTMRLPRVRIRGTMTLTEFLGAVTDNR